MPQLGAQQSPQGIAALSMGNPAPLQQRVQQAGKDPQTGLPKDLVDALALNIVTNEQDAGKREMAMQQLQQAAGPTGQMPTVVQSLQQQAQQKMQAMQQHAMQQQAMQQPQGQGIDQAPVDFHMADGGIVGFAGPTGSVPKAEDEGLSKYADIPKLAAEAGVSTAVYRQVADVAARMGTTVGEILKTAGKEALSGAGQGIKGAGRLVASGPGAAILAGGAPATQFAGDVIRAASPAQRESFYDSPMMGAMSGDTALAAAIMNESKPAQEAKAAETKKPQVVTQSIPTSAGPGQDYGTRADTSKPVAEVDPQDAAIARLLGTGGGRPAGGPPRPAANAGIVGSPVAANMQRVTPNQMRSDADVEEARTRAQMLNLAPNTDVYDKLNKELEERKQKLNAPAQGWDALMEGFRNISESGGRGRKWYEAGAQGAALGRQRQTERETQQFEFTKQQLENENKKNETSRLFQLDVLKAGKDAYKNEFSRGFDMFKEQGQNDRQASQNATQLAATAMQVAELARGHSLNAMMDLKKIGLAEKRADKDAEVAARQRLVETGKLLQATMKEPDYARLPPAQQAQDHATLQAIIGKLAEQSGVQAGFSTAPTNNVRPALK